MGEDQQEPEGPTGDVFEVTVRIGNATRTIGYAGAARVNGAAFNWVAEFTETGISINPRPTEGGTWDAEANQWTLTDGSTVSGDAINALLEGLGHILQNGTRAADAAAQHSYEHAITDTFGPLPTQRALFL